jgi:hypothetical protein
MVYQTRNILTESEVNRIRGLYGVGPVRKKYVFEACITVDEKYFIMNDEVFDLQEKKLLGNLWESMDIFKTLFQNIKIVNEEYQDIRESIINLPITESKEDLEQIKKLMLEFDFFKDTWVGKQLSDAGTGISNTLSQSYEGLKKLGVSISEGDWSNIVNLLSKGILFILRKLKDAMYSTVGMIVDAILIATGIGKTVQWIPWALITALDVYQLKTGDYEGDEKNNPMWLKLLFFGFDILGLVSAGAMAKAAREEFKPLVAISNDVNKTTEFLSKNPKMKSIIETILNGAKKVPEMLNNASSFIGKKFPAGTEFIKSIFGGIGKVLKNLEESLSKLIGKTAAKGTMAGAKTGTAFYGFDKVGNAYTKLKTGFNDVQLKNMEKFNNIKNAYGGMDPFDVPLKTK